MRRIAIISAMCVLHGCCRLPLLSGPAELTLADLEPVDINEQEQSLPAVGLDELATIYREALQQQQDVDTRVQVQHRLADIELLGSEADLAVAEGDAVPFAEAISAYESLLHDNPDYERSDVILYQLSKAYDLGGDSDKSLAALERLSETRPESAHVLESDFRRAERYFVDADYQRAEATYARVIAHGPDTLYYTRALYMEGWARFKLDRYQAAIPSFSGTLDQLLPEDAQLQSLSRGEREMAQDCLRVLALVFSNLEGTQTIASTYEELGVRPYQHLLYESLGQLYLSQERYRDSAQTYQSYSQTYPDSKVAHLFQLRVIEAYEAGGFPGLIVTGKEDYVAAFGVSSRYFLNSEVAVREEVEARLRLFVDQLASHHHALAQAASKPVVGNENRIDSEVVAAHYATAGDYYQLYLDSFPGDLEVSRMAFLLAESRYESGAYGDAIEAYEWVAYQFPDFDRAADAAYAAILAYEELENTLFVTQPDNHLDNQIELLQRARIDSELRFAAHFDDPRVPAVLGHAATQLFRLQDFELAITTGSTLTQWQPTQPTELVVPAWLVIGHSQFELLQFGDAELSYEQARALMQPDDTRYDDTVERVAAAIYKQAEAIAATGEDALAARQFERVMAAAPASGIRVNAQFDAASSYMRADELAQASALLIDFRERYPQHELTASIAATLVANYEQQALWHEAAVELDGIYAVLGKNENDNENQREMLYVAAQYYDRAGDQAAALKRYRSYAHNYPEPIAENMEAMNRLAQMYQHNVEPTKQRYWLEKMIVAHDNAGSEQTARSSYLAASSASVKADDTFIKYRAIKLTLPIKTSLRNKKRAMDNALAAYEKTNAYGIEDFSTLASYRMASIYQQLSDDLMDSERPESLDALALEQYGLMLEEQAFPFEEKAIAIHESNARRSWEGVYDPWVKDSYTALAKLLPARYGKLESVAAAKAATNEALISMNPETPEAYNQKAIALREEGQFAAAEQTYLSALVEYEPDPDTHRNLGILYDLYRGEHGKALRHFQRYQELTDGQDRVVQGWIAELERRQVAMTREFF